MTILGIIFSNLHDKSTPELTMDRTMASVPFGCRYRLVDFPLSNMANAGIHHIGVITHYNYFSLMKHLSTGKVWDLSRNHKGLVLLPPFVSGYTADNKTLYNTRLEAIKSIAKFLWEANEEYIVMSDSDVICNVDVKEIINYHIHNNADITLVTKKIFIPRGTNANHTLVLHDSGKVYDIEKTTKDTHGFHDVMMNVTVMRLDFLKRLVTQTFATGENSFTQDIIKIGVKDYNIQNYSYEGAYFCIDSLTSFFNANMELLNKETQKQLFATPNRPILTTPHSSPPTRYLNGGNVQNSMIADGCTIQGTVKNSIIFRGVKIGKGTLVENSILFENTNVGIGSNLKFIITEKNVNISDGITLAGHMIKPFFIEKNTNI